MASLAAWLGAALLSLAALSAAERPALGPSSFVSVAQHALQIVQQPEEDEEEDRDEALDRLFDRDFNEEEAPSPMDSDDLDDDASSYDSFRHGSEQWLEDSRKLHYCRTFILNLTELDISEYARKRVTFVLCHKVVGDLNVTLQQPWEFHNDAMADMTVELEGRLVISAEEEFTCLTVEGNLTISGFASFTNCHASAAGAEGGAIQSQHLTVLQGGRLEFQNCSSSFEGGAISTWSFTLYGSVGIHHCHSQHGGGIIAPKVDIFSGELLVENSRSQWSGGSVRTYNFTQWGGSVVLQQSASYRGGALWAMTCHLRNGSLRVQNAFANEGGGIFAPYFAQSGGSLELRDNTASDENNSAGGCLNSREVELKGGTALFQGCKVTGERGARRSEGGAISTAAFAQSGGSAVFKDNWATAKGGRGGAIYLEDVWKQSSGELHFQNCHAEKGGAIAFGHLEMLTPRRSKAQRRVITWIQMSPATVTFDACHAAKEGGAIHSVVNISLWGQNSFQNCSCDEGAGGAMRLMADLDTSGNLSFQGCTSRRPGAAVAASGHVELKEATFEKCDSGMLGVVLYVEGNLTAQQMKIHGAPSGAGAPDQHVAVGGTAWVKSLRCSGDCDLSTVAQDPELGDLFCAPGHGRHRKPRAVGCEPCSAGTMAIFENQNAECQPCPSSELCLPSRLKMLPGQTLHPSNLSLALDCPNPQACLGGELSQGAGMLNSRKEVEEVISKSMCRDGYTETVCWKCAPGYGMTDASPLLCTKCTQSSFAMAGSISFYVAKDAWPFLIGVASALTPGSRRKQSTVLLNQLMAFGMISQHIVNILMQTQAFQALQLGTRRWLVKAGHVLAFAQGEGVADEEGLLATSRQCLLESLGWSNSLVYAHWVTAFVPCLLIFLVSLKQPWLALMVGANVFLPAFAGAFGKYFLGFDDPGDEKPLLQVARPFLPESGLSRLFICVMLPACFLGTTFWWYRSIEKSVETEKAPPHVLYLTLAYKDQWRTWEIERFLRKMTISLVAASLSVSFWDATHLFMMSLILLVSLLSILICRPYIYDWWNVTEALLLSAALMMISLVSLLRAHEAHLASDLEGGKHLAAFLVLLAPSICGVMMVLVMINVYSEWQGSSLLGERSSDEIADLDG